jgi:hypothetical protein
MQAASLLDAAALHCRRVLGRSAPLLAGLQQRWTTVHCCWVLNRAATGLDKRVLLRC